MLCYVMLCYVMLCYIILYYMILHLIILIIGEDGACPHKPGACLKNEELFLGVCYKQCRLLKGTNGVSTNGVTAFVLCVFFDRGICWVPICQNPSSVRTFSPNLSNFITDAATPFALTPSVRNLMLLDMIVYYSI